MWNLYQLRQGIASFDIKGASEYLKNCRAPSLGLDLSFFVYF